MRSCVQKAAGHAMLRKRMISQLGDEPRRISTYRMFRSPEFQELCDFYMEGIGFRRFEQFVEYALRLEKTF